MISKIERLLDLIAALLHAERPLTAAQIHERIPGYPEDRDSFKRAFERDKRDLREMDIPLRIETVPGSMPAEDGYRIDQDEYGLPDPGLSADELAAIHLAATAIRLDGIDAAGGLAKLGGSRADAAAGSSAVLPTAPHLVEMFDAVSAHRQLRFRYRDKDRRVDPFRLHHERGHWYVQAFDHDVAETRSFRLDRVEGPITAGEADSIEVVIEPGDNPIRLDPWALGDDTPIPAVVVVRPPHAMLAARAARTARTVEWDADGSVRLGLDVRNVAGFRAFVLGFLDDAEVLSPPELREDMAAWLSAMVDGEAV